MLLTTTVLAAPTTLSYQEAAITVCKQTHNLQGLPLINSHAIAILDTYGPHPTAPVIKLRTILHSKETVCPALPFQTLPSLLQLQVQLLAIVPLALSGMPLKDATVIQLRIISFSTETVCPAVPSKMLLLLQVQLRALVPPEIHGLPKDALAIKLRTISLSTMIVCPAHPFQMPLIMLKVK